MHQIQQPGQCLFTSKGLHTPPRLKPTASCLYPTTLLPLVWPVQQKSCIEHTVSTCCQNGRTANTQPIRESDGSDGWQPTLSDFACCIGADNVHAALKASNAAEHTGQICSQPRPSVPKRFRRPTVWPVCSCLKFNAAGTPLVSLLEVALWGVWGW